MPTVQHFYSDRGIPLVYHSIVGKTRDYTVLTIENYLKWYSLYLVKPDNTVEPCSWENLDRLVEPGESPWCDHVPNPVAVANLAMAREWYLCDESLEMIIGRWEREVRKNYEGTYIDEPP